MRGLGEQNVGDEDGCLLRKEGNGVFVWVWGRRNKNDINNVHNNKVFVVVVVVL